jgi:DNA-binding transcriptional regulator YhcF (GntR family)
MRDLVVYIKDIIGLELEIKALEKDMLSKLPMYLKEGYIWNNAKIANRPFILAETIEENNFSIAQIQTHFEQVRTTFSLPVVAVLHKLEAYNRKRLIERRIAFIVPNKQLYLPDFLINFIEYRQIAKKTQIQLTPTAQQLLLLYLLDKFDKTEIVNKTFKELAVLLSTNPMGITRAVENLKQLELVDIISEKEKYIHFRMDKNELWNCAEREKILINPILKKVFVDERPQGAFLQSNASALPEYTNMNPSRQQYLAVEKSLYYALRKSNALINENEREGKYCLEIWKYNPEPLIVNMNNESSVVDPLSLYLSLKDSQDERIEMALEQIIEQAIW